MLSLSHLIDWWSLDADAQKTRKEFSRLRFFTAALIDDAINYHLQTMVMRKDSWIKTHWNFQRSSSVASQTTRTDPNEMSSLMNSLDSTCSCPSKWTRWGDVFVCLSVYSRLVNWWFVYGYTWIDSTTAWDSCLQQIRRWFLRSSELFSYSCHSHRLRHHCYQSTIQWQSNQMLGSSSTYHSFVDARLLSLSLSLLLMSRCQLNSLVATNSTLIRYVS